MSDPTSQPTATRTTVPGAPAPTAPPDRTLQPLHPRAVTLWRLSTLARGALLAAGAAGLEWALELPLPTGLVATMIAVAAVLLAIFLPPLQYDAWRFALRESDLYLRHGVLFRTTSIVPHARIQHVDTRHGPIDRSLGLAAVVVYTAGTRGAILTIPALGAREAERVRDSLAALSGAGDAV